MHVCSGVFQSDDRLQVDGTSHEDAIVQATLRIIDRSQQIAKQWEV
jgi:hypothetical protein